MRLDSVPGVGLGRHRDDPRRPSPEMFGCGVIAITAASAFCAYLDAVMPIDFANPIPCG
jgi:hypothetical protein